MDICQWLLLIMILISNDLKVYEQTSFGHKNESTSQRAYKLKTVCLCWLALLV